MKIRTMNIYDVKQVENLEKIAWRDEAATNEQLLSRMEACPEGSIVAQLPDGEIVGYAAAMRTSSLGVRKWSDITNDGFIIEAHEPEGHIAFGVGMSALPKAASLGVSGAIIQHYGKIFAEEGSCTTLCLGSRLPGYAQWHAKHGGEVEEYLNIRRNGHSIDPELCLYEKAGFKLMWPIANYFPCEKSGHYGALVCKSRWEI